jgi:hypothetical protein
MHEIEGIPEPLHALWPELWIWLPQLSECELKVWLYLRAWLPEGGQPAEIPLRQIQQGTGLSRSSVIRGQAGLRAKALLGGEERPGEATRYWRPAQNAVAPVTMPCAIEYTLAAALTHPVEICDGGGESNRIESNLKLTKELDSIRATAYPDTGLASPTPAANAALEARMRQITGHFQPGAGPMAIKANITRILRLWHTSGRAEAAFTGLLQTAVDRTEARMMRPGARPVACPISYLFTVLERLLVAEPVARRTPGGAARRFSAPAPAAETLEAGVPDSAPVAEADSLPLVPAVSGPVDLAPSALDSTGTADTPVAAGSHPAGGDLPRIWQQALVLLRLEHSPDDFQRILRYTVLQDLDPVAGQACLAVPADWMQRQIVTRLADSICRALAHVIGSPIQLVVALFGPVGSLYCSD